MSAFGVVYLAYGNKAVSVVKTAIESLRRFHDWPICVSTNQPLAFRGLAEHVRESIWWDSGARWQKVNLDNISPFAHTLYLDADTKVRQSLAAIPVLLVDGWDMVIAPSVNQGTTLLQHVSDAERDFTLDQLGYEPVQLQGGVFAFRRVEPVIRLFEFWRHEWARFGGQDQGALLRALAITPMRVWMLGRPFNGGEVIEHEFGRAR